MTHIENIPHILRYGITHKDSRNANPNFVNIGDTSLINNRSSKKVIVNNGILKGINPKFIVLGEYIPFYFGVKMPMLYVMQIGGNFVERATPPEDIVYLGCPVVKVVQSQMDFYFSDGHATDGLTTFYDSTKIDQLPELIDWSAVKEPYWGGQENLNIKRKKQAEFLVKGDLDSQFLIGFGCYNRKAKQTLLDYGIEESKIKIIPQAYYN